MTSTPGILWFQLNKIKKLKDHMYQIHLYNHTHTHFKLTQTENHYKYKDQYGFKMYHIINRLVTRLKYLNFRFIKRKEIFNLHGN